MCREQVFIDWVKNISKEYLVVICVGGGAQINKALKPHGLHKKPHGPLGREIDEFAHKQIARDVLERNRDQLRDILAEQGVSASVIVPVLDVGTVLCHVNGDTFVLAAYLGFDRLFVITTNERLAKKQKQFSHLPKVEVCSVEV